MMKYLVIKCWEFWPFSIKRNLKFIVSDRQLTLCLWLPRKYLKEVNVFRLEQLHEWTRRQDIFTAVLQCWQRAAAPPWLWHPQPCPSVHVSPPRLHTDSTHPHVTQTQPSSFQPRYTWHVTGDTVSGAGGQQGAVNEPSQSFSVPAKTLF